VATKTGPDPAVTIRDRLGDRSIRQLARELAPTSNNATVENERRKIYKWLKDGVNPTRESAEALADVLGGDPSEYRYEGQTRLDQLAERLADVTDRVGVLERELAETRVKLVRVESVVDRLVEELAQGSGTRSASPTSGPTRPSRKRGS